MIASPKAMRVLVVDDEAPARQRLRDLLAQDPQVKAVLETGDGHRAVEMIRSANPDLIFLDVQMPELDGFAVIQAVGPAHLPLTVFVTAYDQHAIRAFEANALDYLLKPFGDDRFESTMARAKTRLDERNLREFANGLLQMVPPDRHLDRLVVKCGGTTRFVRVSDIEWIEAAGVYVNLHVAGKELLYRAALNELAANIDPARFIRIHRSAIVNIDSIQHLQPISHGEFEVILKSGARSRVTRTYRMLLENRLRQSL